MSKENATVTGKLSFLEKLGFSFGDVASNFMFQSFMAFLAFFYTDVYGLDPIAMAWMFLVTRWFDAVNDPLMGVIADRTRTRWGKFRPYLMWFALPFAACGAAMYYTPDFDAQGKIVYAYITYTAMMVVYTAINIPYSALMGVMTPNPKERTALASFRFVGAFAGGTLLKALAPEMFKYFGSGSTPQTGYFITMLIFAGAASGLWFANFALTRERVEPPKDQRANLGRDLRNLLRNGPWWVLVFLGLFTLAAFSIRGGVVMYYFKYVVPEELQTYNGYELSGWFLAVGGFANMVGAGFAGLLSQYVSKHKLYIILATSASALMCAFFLIPPQLVGALFIMEILINLLLGPTSPILFAMYTDCADFSEYKDGRRATGLVMSASSFAQKMGWTIGGFGTGMLLAAFGYVANQQQTPTAILGLRLMITVFPALLASAGAATVFLYKLSDPYARKVEERLLFRRDQGPLDLTSDESLRRTLELLAPADLGLAEVEVDEAAGTAKGVAVTSGYRLWLGVAPDPGSDALASQLAEAGGVSKVERFGPVASTTGKAVVLVAYDKGHWAAVRQADIIEFQLQSRLSRPAST